VNQMPCINAFSITVSRLEIRIHIWMLCIFLYEFNIRCTRLNAYTIPRARLVTVAHNVRIFYVNVSVVT
jgi:hypothetical protein